MQADTRNDVIYVSRHVGLTYYFFEADAMSLSTRTQSRLRLANDKMNKDESYASSDADTEDLAGPLEAHVPSATTLDLPGADFGDAPEAQSTPEEPKSPPGRPPRAF